MGNLAFITTYLDSCVSGMLSLADCRPAWQMLVIVVLLLLAISTLAVLRFSSRSQPSAN